MVYRRNYRRKRFVRRRRAVPWYNRKYSVSQMASKAIKGVNYLRGLVNAELKKYDVVSADDPSSSGIVIPLHDMGTGDSDSQRNGNSIFVRYVNVGGFIRHNMAATNPSQVRIMLFIDKQQVGDSVPTPSMVLETVANTQTPYSKLNSDTVGRFSILFSRIYQVNEQRPCISYFIKKSMRHHIRYNGMLSTDVQKGGIYLLIAGPNVTNNPRVTWNSRLSFHDN